MTTWRYVHRDDIKEYEREGWVRAVETDGIRNQYFVLMVKDQNDGH